MLLSRQSTGKPDDDVIAVSFAELKSNSGERLPNMLLSSSSQLPESLDELRRCPTSEHPVTGGNRPPDTFTQSVSRVKRGPSSNTSGVVGMLLPIALSDAAQDVAQLPRIGDLV